jgi:hypothetical protein
VIRIEANIFAIRKRAIKGETVHMLGKIYFKHSLVLIPRSYVISATYLNPRDFNLRRNGKMKTTSRIFRVGILRKGKAGGVTNYNLIYK